MSDLLKRADEMRQQAATIRDHAAKAELMKLSAMWERLARAAKPANKHGLN